MVELFNLIVVFATKEIFISMRTAFNEKKYSSMVKSVFMVILLPVVWVTYPLTALLVILYNKEIIHALEKFLKAVNTI